MAIYILGPDSNGDCCTCAERMNVCDTCGEPSPCLQGRDKEGESSICGIQRTYNFVTKYYKRLTLAGTLQWCQAFGSCTNITLATRLEFSGECGYDIVDNECVEMTPTAKASQSNAAGSLGSDCESVTGFGTPTDYSQCNINPPGGGGYGPGFSSSETETSYTIEGDGICYGSFGKEIDTGSASITWSSEDTIVDVIARAEALLAAASWSAWGYGSPTANYCVSSTTADITDSEWRIYREGLLPNTEYSFTVTIWRTLCFSEPDYELYDTISATATTDATGLLVTSGTAVPNDEGYYSQARCDCVFTPV